MASIPMLTPVFGSATATPNHPHTTACGDVTFRAARLPESVNFTVEETGTTKRRELVFTAAIATACSIARIAIAEDEPKRGTEEAKKKYAPVCVTMPTARICHK